MKFHQFEGDKPLLELLRVHGECFLIESMNLIPTTHLARNAEKKRSHEVCTLLKNLLFIVHNTSRTIDYAEADLEWLTRLSARLVDNEDVPGLASNERLLMFFFLARCMGSRELNELKRRKEFVLKTIHLIKRLTARMSIDDRPPRMSIDSSEIYERVECVYTVGVESANELAVGLADLLECIQVLSTKGVMPWELVRNLNLIDDLKIILENGNDCEIEHTLKV